MNDTKAPNKAPAYTEVARGAGSLVPCPHCDHGSSNAWTWPFCSFCWLFVIPMDELDLSPVAELWHWHDDPRISLLN